VTTSFGGAFASAVLAATPGPETQEENTTIADNKIVGGLLAVGLIAAVMSKHGDKAPANGSSSPSNNGTTAGSSSGSSGSGLTADEQQAFNLLNADRQANGLAPLKINMSLVGLAENYAQDMINRNFFSHYNPEGQSPFDRMAQAGISYRYAGENLAINSSVAGAEKAFMNSSGHKANILSPNYTEVGIGVRYSSNGSVYVVQEFIGR